MSIFLKRRDKHEPISLDDELELEIISGEESSSTTVPTLSNAERREVARRTNVSAIVLHESVREAGERELRRSPSTLAWSGLAAGLSMGFSLVSQGLLLASPYYGEFLLAG